MRAYITTTATVNLITETDAAPGDAATRVWKDINQAVPIRAGIAQTDNQVLETRVTVLNPAQVIAIHELED